MPEISGTENNTISLIVLIPVVPTSPLLVTEKILQLRWHKTNKIDVKTNYNAFHLCYDLQVEVFKCISLMYRLLSLPWFRLIKPAIIIRATVGFDKGL